MTQTKEAIREYLKTVGGDGHTIFKDEFIRKMGFTDEFVAKFAKDHTSGDGYKDTLFAEGKKVDKIMGVYALDFAYGIAKDVGADMTIAYSKTGRGFQAQALVVAIRNVFLEEAIADIPDADAEETEK